MTEKFIGGVMAVLRTAIHPRARIRRLLACRTLEAQRELFRREWDSRRWRLLFTLLLNRAVFRKTYHPAFFAHVDNPSFAGHFRRLADHTLTEIPISTNYFVHFMLTGAYPPEGLPPYLAGAGPATWPSSTGRTRHTCAPCRTAASTVSRSRTSWSGSHRRGPTSCSPRWCAPPSRAPASSSATSWAGTRCRWRRDRVVEDQPRGEEMIRRDRSAVQRRIAVCAVNP